MVLFDAASESLLFHLKNSLAMSTCAAVEAGGLKIHPGSSSEWPDKMVLD
jgi:hypothetical protein